MADEKKNGTKPLAEIHRAPAARGQPEGHEHPASGAYRGDSGGRATAALGRAGLAPV